MQYHLEPSKGTILLLLVRCVKPVRDRGEIQTHSLRTSAEYLLVNGYARCTRYQVSFSNTNSWWGVWTGMSFALGHNLVIDLS
jgi:hypothetical protein